MPNCTVECSSEPTIPGKLGRRIIEASFDGGDISSDAGVLLLKRAAGAPVATNSRATSCACCWQLWPARS